MAKEFLLLIRFDCGNRWVDFRLKIIFAVLLIVAFLISIFVVIIILRFRRFGSFLRLISFLLWLIDQLLAACFDCELLSFSLLAIFA